MVSRESSFPCILYRFVGSLKHFIAFVMVKEEIQPQGKEQWATDQDIRASHVTGNYQPQNEGSGKNCWLAIAPPIDAEIIASAVYVLSIVINM